MDGKTGSGAYCSGVKNISIGKYMNYTENLTKDEALVRENEIVLLNEQDVLGKKFSIAVFLYTSVKHGRVCSCRTPSNRRIAKGESAK